MVGNVLVTGSKGTGLNPSDRPLPPGPVENHTAVEQFE